MVEYQQFPRDGCFRRPGVSETTDEYHESIRHWKSHFYTHLKRKRRNAFDISGEKDTADAEVWKYYIKKKDAA